MCIRDSPRGEIQRKPVQVAPRTVRPRAAPVEPIEVQPRLKPQRVEKRAAAVRLPDRLTVAGGSNVGEPSLRLATEILSWRGGAAEAKEPQREILRLEFRMLSALHEQVTTQMATAEKLRNMETTLIELQQRTTDFAPVSYTHLDVYKRQIFPGGNLPPMFISQARKLCR